MKTFAVAGAALAAGANALTYTNVSEVPLYGLSPPVYPTREYTNRAF